MDSLQYNINSVKLIVEESLNVLSLQRPEVLLLSLLLVALVPLLSLARAFRLSIFRAAESTQLPLPPGTFGWPLIGETMRLKKSSSKPEDFVLQRMRKYNKTVFKTSLFGERMAAFCGPAGNKLLFSSENRLVATWWPRSVQAIFPHSIVSGRSNRKLLTSFLRPESLRRHVGTMDVVARSHLDAEWAGRSQVTASHLVKRYTYAMTCRLFAGVDDPDRVSKLVGELEALGRGVMQVPVKLPGTPYYRAIGAAEAIKRELGLMIEQRRVYLREKKALPEQDDLLWHLLTTEDEEGGEMRDEEMVENIMLLLYAGHNPSCCAITLLLKNLAEMPRIYDRVLKEQREIAMSKKEGELLEWDDIQKMKYSWNVVFESLRLSPPISGSFREALSDFTFGGFTIPKGWKVFWSSHTTHRNPDYFPMPEKFDPSRFEGGGPAPYTFIPFGGGPRMCPGKEFARLEILVFLHNLVNRFRWEPVIPGEKIKAAGGAPYPAQGLPIRLLPHHV